MIVELIKSALDAVSSVFGYSRDRQNLNNTPEMKSQATAQQDAAVVDQARKDVASGDVDTINKDLS